MEIALGILAAAIVAAAFIVRGALAHRESSPASELDVSKKLIDRQLGDIRAELRQVTSVVQRADAGITGQLKVFSEQTFALTATTDSLREVLASSRARGQWGERMAEDILRAAGLEENVNYRKQATVDGAGSRPDFVFLLPGGLRMNMDVKFPLDNFVRAGEATNDVERKSLERAFIRDVRARVRELTGREYIDPEGGTVDYALLFIPNESVYAFVQQHGAAVLDEGLRSKIICCSPMTLFAVLAVVRQAVDNFALQRASNEIVSLMGRFEAEWGKFSGALETMGRRLDSAKVAYEELMGPRKRQLEKPLVSIGALRRERGLPVAGQASLDET